jgi:hypothetical protein
MSWPGLESIDRPARSVDGAFFDAGDRLLNLRGIFRFAAILHELAHGNADGADDQTGNNGANLRHPQWQEPLPISAFWLGLFLIQMATEEWGDLTEESWKAGRLTVHWLAENPDHSKFRDTLAN